MSRSNSADGPEDIDATFAEIVADLRAEGVGTTLEQQPDDEPTPPPPSPAPGPPEQTVAASGWRGADREWEATVFGDDPASDDEHFVPPEPPPLPRPRKGALVVLLFFVLGLLLLIAPGVIGLSSSLGTPIGLLVLAVGIGLLLLRVRQGPPDGADPDSGAQV
ncbi:hypothetical protein [Amycolatopsis albispora]|uniref:DUF308 domain-containing protein n=1 Tax=Amycolatopsis albispora TaxID=1804986 RepID=A0A344L776_9PSEU|nr:hypothetical protein [Amycolatopsis albispora]AXB43900.1 hypothetical protein A4R43_16345 [Amycolatopsis albispora]